MNTPTTRSISHLLGDHQAIRRVLSAYEQFLTEVEGKCDRSGGFQDAFDPKELWEVLDYLGDHLLMSHEEKEEVALLPELARHGLSWEDTDLQHTRLEHRHIRYLMRSLRQTVHQLRAWSRDDCRHFLGTSRELVAFLQRHMAAEEKHLFGKLDQSFGPQEDERLANEFEAIAKDFGEMPDAQTLQAAGAAFLERYPNQG
jgi:hemerythrin-like domain-containing protein